MADHREVDHQWYEQFNERTMTVVVKNGHEWVVPVKYEVCDTCGGKGKHVNPSIDAHGISTEEFAEDPDFADAYWRGEYDVPCNECHGLRVSLCLDEALMSDDDLERTTRFIQAFYTNQYEAAREREMGY